MVTLNPEYVKSMLDKIDASDWYQRMIQSEDQLIAVLIDIIDIPFHFFF